MDSLLVNPYALARWFKTAAAARLINVAGADYNTFAAIDQALGVVGGIAAADTDSQSFGDVLRDTEQLRHGFEGSSRIILIETRNDHALAHVRKLVTDLNQI